MEDKKLTPLMQQYIPIKKEYPDALVFFQVGDFYELFYEDAQKAAHFLGITLTKRGKSIDGIDIPLCGVPVHTKDHYIAKLVKGGFCIVICDQVGQPKAGTIVKRAVTQVITPGTLTDEKLLDQKSASYILACSFLDDVWGLVFVELLTAQLHITTITAGAFKSLDAELARFLPDEIIISNTPHDLVFIHYFKKQGYFVSSVQKEEGALLWAQKQFLPESYAMVEERAAFAEALSVVYGYFKKNNSSALDAFKSVFHYNSQDFLALDASTQKHLELIANAQGTGRANSLYETLDNAVTAMGSRMIKKWLLRPLIDKKMIAYRFDVVRFFKQSYLQLLQLQMLLKNIGDGERVVGRIALDRASFSDYLQLLASLSFIQEIEKSMVPFRDLPFLNYLLSTFDSFDDLQKLLSGALYEERVEDFIIKPGYDVDLDRMRKLVSNSSEELLLFEQREIELTGITSLKVRFNDIHGYYIEITHANAHLVPARYIRKQTLVGKERYTCEELKKLEEEFLSAATTIKELEKGLFTGVKNVVREYVPRLRRMMAALAECDALLSFASCAHQRSYSEPTFSDSNIFSIKDGRHPVIERSLGVHFIPNDTVLDDTQSTLIITGPNMGGKSTYLRHVALLSIMAQVGSFVPARHAIVPLLDRIFTRIGASDNVAEGKSTFLVEMEETAYICHNATERSLVILDEVGRGTSTFDGLSLAQAIVEYIHTKIKARCLFATHYHELTKLEKKYPGIVSYYVASRKVNDQIIFLHTLVKGAADGSFGLEVAKLAALPDPIIKRAYQLKEDFSHEQKNKAPSAKVDHALCIEKKALLEKRIAFLETINYEELSPKKAFDLLWSFKDTKMKNL